MKLYVVKFYYCEFEEGEIKGIFTTEQKAQNYIEEDKTRSQFYKVEEYEADKGEE